MDEVGGRPSLRAILVMGYSTLEIHINVKRSLEQENMVGIPRRTREQTVRVSDGAKVSSRVPHR